MSIRHQTGVVIVVLGILQAMLLAPRARATDMLYLRDGQRQAGTIVSETNGSYVFSDRRGTQPIAKETVRFAVYGDPTRAAEALGLQELKKHLSATNLAEVLVLPAPDFSREILDAIRNAKTSVRVMTYYLSGGDSSGSREFFELLVEKAQAKKSVTVIAPFGSRAHAAAKISSMNSGQKLENQGVKVRYLQQSKVQHKKLIIVDGKIVFLGSSNLTSAGMSKNQEINVRITDPTFVAEAAKDFTSMLRKSKSRDKLKL